MGTERDLTMGVRTISGSQIRKCNVHTQGPPPTIEQAISDFKEAKENLDKVSRLWSEARAALSDLEQQQLVLGDIYRSSKATMLKVIEDGEIEEDDRV